MEYEAPARKWLSLATEREALTRMEDAARTVEQFEKVTEQWDHLDENRQRRERDHEKGRPTEEMLHWIGGRNGEMRTEFSEVVPRPLGNIWWRQLLRGDFLDLIFDCPYEMHEQTTSRPISDILKTLKDSQLEVLYYRVIRQYTFQRIAAIRGQTDRNVLKLYATLIASLRKKLHKRLAPRFDAGLPLTLAQRQFMQDYRADRIKTGKPKFSKQPDEGIKKVALDDEGDE